MEINIIQGPTKEITREMVKYAERHRSKPWMPTLKDGSLLAKPVCDHLFPSHWAHVAIYTNTKPCCTPEVNTACQLYQLKTSDQLPNIIPNKPEKEQQDQCAAGKELKIAAEIMKQKNQ